MVTRRPRRHDWLVALAPLALLGACAGQPSATTFSLPPGISADARTFAIAPLTNDAARVVAPLVDEQLRRLGYQPDHSPRLIVVIGTSKRSRAVGALANEQCRESQWVEQPGKKWLIGGGEAVGLQIHIIDAKTQQPVFYSSASMRGGVGSYASQAGRLVAAALNADPRQAAACKQS